MMRLDFKGSSQLLLVLVVCGAGCNSRSSAENAASSAPATPAAAQTPSADLVNPAIPEAKPVAPAGESFDTFEAYWPVFRAAVQSNDKAKIASLTQFPFETRGDADGDPVKQLTREQFMQAFDSMLSEDPGLLMNGKETQREHIARSGTLTGRQYASGDTSARVGVFQFEAQGGRWWFTRAYVGEE
jgi:hypothetical protein